MQTRFPASVLLGVLLLVAAGSSSCSTIEKALAQPMADELHADLPARNQVTIPRANPAGRGDYVSPFRASGELAAWAQDALDGAEPAGFLGAVRAQNASWWSTGVEVVTGERPSIDVNAQTLESAGGWDNVRATSDVTFDDVDDLAVYLYAVHGDDPRFVRVLKITQDLHPGLGPAYREAIRRASVKGVAAPAPMDLPNS